MRLLRTYIVEDSPVVREDLIATLEELSPVQVVGSAGGEAMAMRWLGEAGHLVDLVIVDISLKEGSGLGVLHRGRAQAQPFKMIVLCNDASVAMRRTCLALGADSVFDKSHQIGRLVDYCGRLAARTPIASPWMTPSRRY